MSDSSDKRAALKQWLRSRLTEGDRAQDDWHKHWEAAWGALLETQVRELVDRKTVKALIDQLIVPETVAALARPVGVEVAQALIAEMRADKRPVEQSVPKQAQQKLKAALSRPGLVHPDSVRTMLRGEAVQSVFNDVLYTALKDFSTLIPRMLVKHSSSGPFGMLGGAGALVERMMGDIEGLLEPEIRSFISDSSGRVLESAVDLAIDKMGDPSSVGFSAVFIDSVLSKSPAFFLETADDELLREFGAAFELTVLQIAEAAESRNLAHRLTDQFLDSSAEKTVEELFELNDSKRHPPIDALAAATWPVFQALLSSSPVVDRIDNLVEELIDEYESLGAD